MTTPSLLAIVPDAVLDVAQGRRLPGTAVLVDGERIVAVVPVAEVPDAAERIDLPGHTALPGLIDTHSHLIGDVDDGHGYASLLTRSAADEMAFGLRNARAVLRAGFTTVRDVGTFRAFVDVALARAIDEGWAPGPRMQCAGAYIGEAGGGGDIAGLAVDVVLPIELRYGRVFGVGDMRRVVRQLVQGGAGVIKLIATGSVMSTGGVPGAPELSEAQMRAAVEEAEGLGVHVAAHAHGAEGIKRAVRAGVRSIEHGSLMDEEALELMVAHGTYLSADIYGGDYIAEVGAREGWDPDVLRKNEETTLAQREAFRACVAAGVPITLGTDSGIFPHGALSARQLQYHVQWGQSPAQALRSATLTGAELMGWEDRVGQLSAGSYADVIAVPGDPLTDIALLEDVRFVMKGGRVHRHPAQRCDPLEP